MLAATLAAGVAGGLLPSRALAADPPVYIGKNGWLFPSWEHENGMQLSDVQKGLREVAQAHAIFASAGVKLYISMVPSKGRVYLEDLPGSVSVTPEFMTRYHHALDFFAQAGVPAANCLDPMLAGKSENVLFLKADTHWNSYGSRIAALATAKVVGIPSPAPDPLPDGVPIPGSQSELDINGDLVPLLPPALQRNYPPDPLMVTDFTLQGGVKPATFEVAVVGTSYCKENLGFSQTFANAIARPSDLYWQWGSIGPWRLLTQYMEIQKKAGKPLPQIVVWQFSDYVLGTGPEGVGAWGKDNAYASPEAWYSSLRSALKR
jgi:alginate O-acetyltransferase complex protein AlgJ